MELAHGRSQMGGYHYFLYGVARQLQRSLGGRRTEAGQVTELRERNAVLPAAPRLATLIVPQRMIGMSGAGRPCRVPLLVVDILLKVVNELAIEVALHRGEGRPVLQPEARILFHVRHGGEHLGSGPLTERGDGVGDEEPWNALSVQHGLATWSIAT